jgi:hypothetical protein
MLCFDKPEDHQTVMCEIQDLTQTLKPVALEFLLNIHTRCGTKYFSVKHLTINERKYYKRASFVMDGSASRRKRIR